MATLQWATPESTATALTTELNSLANGSLSTLSSAIDNTTGLYEYLAVEVALASINPSGTPYVTVYLFYSLDGTNYEDGSASASHAVAVSLPVTTGSSAKRAVSRHIPLQPLPFKLAVQNNTGVALAASGNTLRYRRFNEQSV